MLYLVILIIVSVVFCADEKIDPDDLIDDYDIFDDDENYHIELVGTENYSSHNLSKNENICMYKFLI